MKIKCAHKLPDKIGNYWYMVRGSLCLTQVYTQLDGKLYYMVLMPQVGEVLDCYHYLLVSQTSPEHWSELIQFES